MRNVQGYKTKGRRSTSLPPVTRKRRSVLQSRINEVDVPSLRSRSSGNNRLRSKSTTSRSTKKNPKSVREFFGGVLDRLQQRSSPSSKSTATTTTTKEPSKEVAPYQLLSPQTQIHQPDDSTETSVTSVSSVSNLDPILSSTSLLESPLLLPLDDTSHHADTKTHPEQEAAATVIQSHVRRYLAHYEYRMAKLQHRLEEIEALKQRQLKKLAQRQIKRKRTEKSVFEYEARRTTRELQRTTRIIPHLFRQAKSLLEEQVGLLLLLEENTFTTNSEVAISMPLRWNKSDSESTLVTAATSSAESVTSDDNNDNEVDPQCISALQDALESHAILQSLAHDYLETLEDVDGVWDAMREKWSVTGDETTSGRRKTRRPVRCCKCRKPKPARCVCPQQQDDGTKHKPKKAPAKKVLTKSSLEQNQTTDDLREWSGDMDQALHLVQDNLPGMNFLN